MVLAKRIAQIINWAYGGKKTEQDGGDPKAWTSERNIVSGTRTNAADVLPMIQTAFKEKDGDGAWLLATL